MAEAQSTPRTIYIDVLSLSPYVAYIPDFLDDAECEHLVENARAKVTRSVTVDAATGKLVEVETRSSDTMFFTRGETPVVKTIEERIAQLTRTPVTHGEGLQVIRYLPGQEYQAHFDFFDPDLPGSRVVAEHGGQRVLTMIMYLNDVEAGGETHFPEIGLTVSPRKRAAVLFYDCTPAGEIDRRTLHAGMPVVAGEKWISTKWVREHEY
ncbi:MAG: 2OG-Fe(II) oxygenase [Acidobacteriota bacterium]|nr:2OG-Fe(II) oxygenase [Acidobacteriota bacterium]